MGQARAPRSQCLIHPAYAPSAPRTCARGARGFLTRTLAGVGVAAVLTVSLTGCGGADPIKDVPSDAVSRAVDAATQSPTSGGSKNSRASSPSSSSTTSSSTSTRLPAGAADFSVPAPARAHSHEGAKEFVRFYFETLERLDAAPQAGVIPQLSTAACTSCREQEDTLKQLIHHGQRYESSGVYLRSGWTIDRASTPEQVIVRFTQQLPAARKLNSQNKLISTEAASSYSVAARLLWTDEGWKSDEVGIDARN